MAAILSYPRAPAAELTNTTRVIGGDLVGAALHRFDGYSQQGIAGLLRDGRLYYEDLRNSSQGRHLLLVTLLEQVDQPLWIPRAQGRIQFYLPDSLRYAFMLVKIFYDNIILN
jgi:hypothetical protein